MLNAFWIQVLKTDEHTGKLECILSSLHPFFHCEKPQQSGWQKLFSLKEWLNHKVKLFQVVSSQKHPHDCFLRKLCFGWFYFVVSQFLVLTIWWSFSYLSVSGGAPVCLQRRASRVGIFYYCFFQISFRWARSVCAVLCMFLTLPNGVFFGYRYNGCTP